MITRFEKGDLVPEWVLRAPHYDLQKEATFGVDVIVYHNETHAGPAKVFPKNIMLPGDFLLGISLKGYIGEWVGGQQNLLVIGRVRP